MRQLAGVVAKDLPRYLAALARGGEAYLGIRNRQERLEPAPDGRSFRCDWQWTSDLHAPKVLPLLGRALMRRALALHPINRQRRAAQTGGPPQVSFLIGHRGLARLPHLLATLESIAGQRGADIECLVVEQDTSPQLPAHLPPWVRCIHTPASADMPYCRSWTFNVAARYAGAPVLVLHDNDMLVPADYAAQILQRIAQGYEVVNLKRFVFYLSQEHTRRVFDSGAGLLDAAPQTIVQNLEAGGSVAVTRNGFSEIGGMDEAFVGWGGEDNEFWERAQTLRVWPWANLPLVHLWHEAQAGKQDPGSRTAQVYEERARIDPAERIRRLREAAGGAVTGPSGWARHKE